MKNVYELKEMVKIFILNFGNPTEEGVNIYNSLPSSLKSFVSSNGRRIDYSDDPNGRIDDYPYGGFPGMV